MSAIEINGQTAVLHDFRCRKCNENFETFAVFDKSQGMIPDQISPCCSILSPRIYLPRNHYASVAENERVVVYEGVDKDGNPTIRVPIDRADEKSSYWQDLAKKRGFERKELSTMREIERVEKVYGKQHMKSGYDGNRAKWMTEK